MNETPWAALMAAAAPRAASIWSSASLGTFLHEYENGADTAACQLGSWTEVKCTHSSDHNSAGQYMREDWGAW